MEEMNGCTLLVNPLLMRLSTTLPSLISLSPLQPEMAVPPKYRHPSPFGKPVPQTTFNEMHIHCILVILTSYTDQSMETCTYYQVIHPRINNPPLSLPVYHIIMYERVLLLPLSLPFILTSAQHPSPYEEPLLSAQLNAVPIVFER